MRGSADPVEEAEEVTLRPRQLDEFVGQPRLKEHLQILLAAARGRGQAADHLLFAGPPGLGKTTLSGIVAAEMDVSLRITSGPALERAGDLAAILTNLDDGDVLFIDEIHRLPRPVEEVLYPAMEDFQLDIVIGKGPAARSIRLDLPRFTLIGATTRTGLITGPLRDRFGFIARLDYYDVDDLVAIVERAARILGVPLEHGGALEIARRSRGTPRIANRLLKRVRDYAEVRADGAVTTENARDRARAVRGRRARARQGRPRHPGRVVRDVRRPAGGAAHAGGRGGGGAGDGRGGLRAVPPQGGPAAAHAAGPRRRPRARTRTCTCRRRGWCRACSPPTTDGGFRLRSLGPAAGRSTGPREVAVDDAAGSRAATSILVRPMSVRHPRMPASGTSTTPWSSSSTSSSSPWRSSCSSSCPSAAGRPPTGRWSESLGVDDEVVTIGGVFGTIRAVDDDRIELEVAPGVLITVARNAIAQAANPAPPESPDPSLDEHPADNGTSDD